MTSSKAIAAVFVVLLAFVAFSEGMSLRSIGVELHCRCIQTENNKAIRSHIDKVELIPANSHCDETEMIVTLKKTGQQVCLDPKAPWVKKWIERILANKTR